MKGLQKFKLVIDHDALHDQKIRTIKGHVKVVIGEAHIPRKEIKVKYICKARTDWTEVYLRGSVHYKDMQVLSKHKVVLHHYRDAPLEPGEHILHFEFEIDISALPPTVEDRYGNISHRIKAVCRGLNLLEPAVTDEWSFKSTPIVDLNTNAEHFIHSVAVDKTIYGPLGRLDKPVRTIQATLDKSGYVPGESIIVTFEMDDSNDFNHPIEASLSQVATYVGRSIQSLRPYDKRTVSNMINTVILHEIPKTTDNMCCVVFPALEIPPTIPSGLRGCGIMFLEYEVVLSGKGFEVKMPIVIGNVPLHVASKGPVCPSGTHVTGTSARNISNVTETAGPSGTK